MIDGMLKESIMHCVGIIHTAFETLGRLDLIMVTSG